MSKAGEPLDDYATAWIAEMRARIMSAEELYRRQVDEEGRRRVATLQLAGIFQQLEGVEDLAGLGNLSSIRDLLDFLDDLHRGREHQWRYLGPFGGNQQYNKEEERFRSGILIAVELYLDALGPRHGHKMRTYRYVAELAQSYGHRISAGRVKTLHHEYVSGRFVGSEFVREFVRSFWFAETVGTARSPALCDHGFPVQRCLMSQGGRCRDILKLASKFIPGVFTGRTGTGPSRP